MMDSRPERLNGKVNAGLVTALTNGYAERSIGIEASKRFV